MPISTGTHQRISARPRRRFGTLAIASTIALATLGLTGPGVSAQGSVTVTAGVGEKTVGGQVYAPGDVTVATGDSVVFTIGSDDPHTVTFGAGPADVPPPFWPVSGFAEPTPETMAAPPPVDLGTVEYDGTGFVNTGFMPGKGTSATVVFTAAGTFPFFCVIHEGMSGQVTVVDDGTVTTADEAAAALASTSEAVLAEVEPLRAERLAATTSTENADGTTTWNVFNGAATDTTEQAGGGSGYLELTEFLPAGIAIQPGDTVTWTTAKIHTVTFVPEGTDPGTLFASEEGALAPLGGTTYDGTAPAHSGILGFPVDATSAPVTEYSLTFPKEGVYPFFCALHASLGQVGVVAVGVPLPEQPA